MTWASPIRCSSSPETIDPEEIVIPSPKRQGATTPRSAAAAGGMGGDGRRTRAAASAEKKVNVKRFPFRVQFVWQPKSATDQAPRQRATHTAASRRRPSTSPAARHSAPAAQPAAPRRSARAGRRTCTRCGPAPAATPATGTPSNPDIRQGADHHGEIPSLSRSAEEVSLLGPLRPDRVVVLRQLVPGDQRRGEALSPPQGSDRRQVQPGRANRSNPEHPSEDYISEIRESKAAP